MAAVLRFGALRIVVMGVILAETGWSHISVIPPPVVAPNYPMPYRPQGHYEKPEPPQPTCHKEDVQPACSCNCNFGTSSEPEHKEHCEWKMVFKAVSGQGHRVFNDFVNGGDINGGVEQAQQITSGMRYRDSEILDYWYLHYIKQVKIEVFKDGVRKSWMIFDGLDSDITNWMSQERLIDSMYSDMKLGSYEKFSVRGDRSYPISFITFRHYGPSCADDCGYLLVSDSEAGSSPCAYPTAYPRPFFLYGKKTDSCSLYASQDAGVGDRFVISVKICEKDGHRR